MRLCTVYDNYKPRTIGRRWARLDIAHSTVERCSFIAQPSGCRFASCCHFEKREKKWQAGANKSNPQTTSVLKQNERSVQPKGNCGWPLGLPEELRY